MVEVKMKTILSISVVATAILISASAYVYVPFIKQTSEIETTVHRVSTTLPQQLIPRIESMISDKVEQIRVLGREAQIIEVLHDSNERNTKLTSKEISALDAEWQTTLGSNTLAESLRNNEISDILRNFRSNHSAFSEIVLTDAVGLIVGLTDTIEDYYQADENWWTDTYDDGIGKVHYGPIEAYRNSKTRGISLYIPLHDPITTQLIGIIKGVIEVDQIKKEL